MESANSSAPRADAALKVRFRLSQLFAAMAVVAILLWTIRSYQVFYESYGGDAMVVALLSFFAVLLASPLLASTQLRRPMCLVYLVVLIVFSIAQTASSLRLAALRGEVNQIVAYLDAYKSMHGAYPSELHGYNFERPELSPLIRYERQLVGYGSPYVIFWNPIGETSFGHYYTPDVGHWFEDD